jgi:hypothetical protein
MLRAADERYRVYTVDEFLSDDFREEPPSLSSRSPISDHVRESLGSRGRKTRLLGAAMLCAAVGTLASLLGANLSRHAASRVRSALASVPARAAEPRSVRRATIGRSVRDARVPIAGEPAARELRTSAPPLARDRNWRSRRYAPRIATRGRRVDLLATPVQSSPSAQPPLTAAVTATVPQRRSAEFGFER